MTAPGTSGFTAEPFSRGHPIAAALSLVNRKASLRGQAATGFRRYSKLCVIVISPRMRLALLKFRFFSGFQPVFFEV